MRYLSTTLATSGSATAQPGSTAIARFLDRFDANSDYNHKLVQKWYVEFGDDDYPCREIGLDRNETPVLAGPNDRNYGFWLDTNMKFDDFERIEITAEQFKEKWNDWTDRQVDNTID